MGTDPVPIATRRLRKAPRYPPTPRLPWSLRIAGWAYHTRPYVLATFILGAMASVSFAAWRLWTIALDTSRCAGQLAATEQLWEAASRQSRVARAELAACEATCPWNAPPRAGRR